MTLPFFQDRLEGEKLYEVRLLAIGDVCPHCQSAWCAYRVGKDPEYPAYYVVGLDCHNCHKRSWGYTRDHDVPYAPLPPRHRIDDTA